MKIMKRLSFSWLIVLLALVGVKAGAVHAQSTQDTILYRLRWTVLGDSTILKYEIGSFRLIQGSSIRYLDFTNPSGLDPDDFFTTDSFVISGSADSIMFCRFASFDDKDYIRPVLVDTSDATALDSIGNLFKTRYSALNVTPSSTAFGLSSTLKYLVEVRRTSDNVVLARLDTLKCYLNSSGQLRFRNYPESFNLRKAALPSSQGTSVYLKVHVLYDLPSSSSVVGYAYQFSGSNTPAEQIYSFANQEGLPTTIPPVYSSENGGANSLKKFANVTSLRPNPAANSMTVTFSQSEVSEMLPEIYTTTGVKVSSLNVSAATLRSGSTTLDIHDLPDGNYTLAATSGGATIFTQFQVLHN